MSLNLIFLLHCREGGVRLTDNVGVGCHMRLVWSEGAFYPSRDNADILTADIRLRRSKSPDGCEYAMNRLDIPGVSMSEEYMCRLRRVCEQGACDRSGEIDQSCQGKRSLRMKKLMTIWAVAVVLMVAGTASADRLTWNFTNAADYYVSGDSGTPPLNTNYLPVITVGVGAYVPARPWIDSDDDAYGSDWAAVFARVNTQAYHLAVGDITGGGFTVSGMNQPNAVYGSLYLSPTGGGGSTVMINMSPMGRTGSAGAFVYTFDLDTLADVKIKNGVDGSWGTAQTTGTFGGAIDWVNASTYSGTYAAFFGPQIGMSGTSGTTFTVSEIQLATVPLPATAWGVMIVLGGLAGTKGLKRLRRQQA
jgi:hypothetical protein